MKKKFLLLIVSATILLINQSNAQQTGIKTSADTLQYAAGVYIGQWLKSNGIKVSSYDLLKKGMNDVLAGKLLINDSLLNIKLLEQIKNNQITSAQEQEQQLFAVLKNQKGVGLMPSGIAYFVDSVGTGNKPGVKDSVEVEIRGFLPNGQIFTDTYQNKQPLKTNISNLIPGLAEGVGLMPVGSKWRIFVPAALAYGSKGLQGLIPPYTALIFQVELKQIFKN
jgi:FKBP-type peptidyl-prolyl cis-trans isomerases 1